jgi:hypothetical protein
MEVNDVSLCNDQILLSKFIFRSYILSLNPDIPLYLRNKNYYRVHRTSTLDPTSTGKNSQYTWGDPKIHGIVKKNYLKCFCKFETSVPLRLDAAIPAPLPML